MLASHMPLHILNAVFLQKFADDVGNGLLLEDAAVGAVVEPVQHWQQRNGVEGAAKAFIGAGNLGDHPGKMPDTGIFVMDGQRRWGIEQSIEVDAWIV